MSELSAAGEPSTSDRVPVVRPQRQWLALAALLLISFALGGLAAMSWRATGAVGRLASAEARIRHLEEQQLSAPQLVVPSLDLFPPGFQRYDAGLPILEIPRSARVVTLQLHRIESGSATDFELVIRDASGAEVWRGKDLEPTASGSFVIAVPRDFLPPGTYQLEVHGLSETEQLLDTYELRLVHEGSSETAGFE